MRVLVALSRLRVTIAYVAISVVVALLMDQLGPHTQWRVLHEASTNLRNLSDGHIATLVTSAFLTDGDLNWGWLAAVAALFAAAEWISGSKRFLLTAAVGHVGATAAVAAGLSVGIHADLLADSLAMTVDVGISYAAAAVVGSMIAYLPARWMVMWATGWIVAVVAAAISDPSFTAFGHAGALFIGFALGAMFAHSDGKRLLSNRSHSDAAERVQPEHSMTSL